MAKHIHDFKYLGTDAERENTEFRYCNKCKKYYEAHCNVEPEKLLAVKATIYKTKLKNKKINME